MENGEIENDLAEQEKRLLAKISQTLETMSERTKPRLVRSGMTLQEKIAYVREHGEEKYLSLPRGEPR